MCNNYSCRMKSVLYIKCIFNVEVTAQFYAACLLTPLASRCTGEVQERVLSPVSDGIYYVCVRGQGQDVIRWRCSVQFLWTRQLRWTDAARPSPLVGQWN